MKHFHVVVSAKVVGETVCKEHKELIIASPHFWLIFQADRNSVLPI